MATQTTNYGLTKPSYNETADIGVINSNMDIIDAKMKAIENKAGSGGGGGNTDTYGHVKVGSVTIDASGDDTIELVAGSNVTLTPDTTSKSVTISATGGGTSIGDMLKSEFVLQGGTGVVLKAKEAEHATIADNATNATNATSATTATSATNAENLKKNDGTIVDADAIITKLSKLNSDGTLDFSNVNNVPTSLSGYGITDAYTKTEVDSKLDSWHKYNGSIEENTVNTTNSDETITFHSIDTSMAYELWFDTSDGQQTTVKSSLISGTDITYVVNTPTAGTKFRLLVKGI